MIVVVPMAGRGSRFAIHGVNTPKPLIPVHGRPMLAWALDSLRQLTYSKIIFVVLQEHETTYGVTALLNEIAGKKSHVITIPAVTEGQLCSVLVAKEMIETDEDVLIASADTYVRSSLHHDIARRTPDCRGIISVANLPGEQWSFARTNADGYVIEVSEKVRISDNASTGLYYFARGCEFISVAERMIANAEKTRGEYYVMPAYQKYIELGWRVKLSVASDVWDMGTPESLDAFAKQFSPAGN